MALAFDRLHPGRHRRYPTHTQEDELV